MNSSYWADEVPRMLNIRFQLRPGNWNAFPKNVKRTLFELETVCGVKFNAKVRPFFFVFVFVFFFFFFFFFFFL
jgi:hypothetical protein